MAWATETAADETVNEQIATIERENRAFWSRMLRERFDRDVTLEVDWESFVDNSAESGWVLYPLYIQQAGIERLLYALTGLMDKDEKFKTAAVYSVQSIHISSATNIKTVKLLFHRGCISYRCFAGDWDGYFSIEQMQQYLGATIPRKSRLRSELEGWLRNLFADDAQKRGTERRASSTTAQEQIVEPQPDKGESEPNPEESRPKSERATERAIPQYEKGLRTELESLYDAFLRALTEKDLERLLNLVEVTKTDEETLRREMEKDRFVSFSDWLLTTYPSLERASFVSLKTKDEDLAGYYMAWLPPYTRDYLNLTLVTYLKTGDRWKIVFRLTEMASAPFQVRKDEDALVKALEVVSTNPLLVLKRPDFLDVAETPGATPKLSKGKKRLKAEVEKTLDMVHASLQQRDTEAFLDAVAVSRGDEKKLRGKSKRLMKEISQNTPDPRQAIFVTLRTMGRNISGYYFVAPYPTNPAFKFVYLRPFVHRDGRWKMVFSLEHDLGVSLNIARSGGDIASRANEVIREIDLLHLDWVMTSLFDDIIKESPA